MQPNVLKFEMPKKQKVKKEATPKPKIIKYVCENNNMDFVGLHRGDEMVFQKVDDFEDGEFILIQHKTGARYGFAYNLEQSVITVTLFPAFNLRKEIISFWKLLSPTVTRL